MRRRVDFFFFLQNPGSPLFCPGAFSARTLPSCRVLPCSGTKILKIRLIRDFSLKSPGQPRDLLLPPFVGGIISLFAVPFPLVKIRCVPYVTAQGVYVVSCLQGSPL